MSHQISILIADDHPLFRDALMSAIEKMPSSPEIVLSGSFDEVIEILTNHAGFDLVLLDLNMPGSKGLSGLAQIRAQFPSVPIVIVSASQDAGTIKKSLALGASGYVTKSSSPKQIREAAQKVLEGDIFVPDDIELGSENDEDLEMINRLTSLTPQQTKVLKMVGEGLLNKQIAYELGVSEATIKAHVSAILLKLNVGSRTQAVIQLSKLSDIGSQ